MKTAKRKGTIYEREIVNNFVAGGKMRIAGRFSGSANKGEIKLDVVGFDFDTRQIFVCQAKDSPKWTASRKIKHEENLKEIFKGEWTIDARFL